MPEEYTILENFSPLIAYTPSAAWAYGGSGDVDGDGDYARYSMGGTRTATTTYGASATFSFNGTGVTLFSAKRPNHGFFNISLDGTFISTNNGSSGALEGIWGPLYSSGPLDDGLHTVVVVNSGSGAGGWFDLDYIGFNTSVTTDTQLVQDTHPSFSYQGSNWSDTVANASQYNGTNGHITCAKGDSVTYTFQGDSVQIYGALGPEMGSYMVSLDGVVSALYDAEQAEFYANTMLYAASALPSSRHDVTLTNVGDSLNTSCLSIDYAIAGLAEGVSSTSESATDSPANTETGSPSAAPDSVTHTPSTPAIVGACVGAAIFAGSTFAALWFFFRRRRASRKTAMVADNPPEFTFRPTWSSRTPEIRQTDPPPYSFVAPNPHHGGPMSAGFGLPPLEHPAIPVLHTTRPEDGFRAEHDPPNNLQAAHNEVPSDTPTDPSRCHNRVRPRSQKCESILEGTRQLSTDGL